MTEKKKKKSILKRWWFWVALIVVIVAIGANMGGSDDAKGDTAKSNEISKKDDKSSNKKEKQYKINDVVKVGDMQYQVISTQVTKQVSPSILPTDAKDTFLVVDMKVKNNGDEKVTVDSSFFKLLRGSKTYDADASASMSANQGEDGNITNSFFLSELNPDVELSGKIVFDVTEETAKATDLILETQTGFWGTEKAQIHLTK